jgi:hypothetical protein
MKLSCLTRFALPALLALPAQAAATAPYSAAFYYGSQNPREFYAYDWLITDPGNSLPPAGAPAAVKNIAYISFGETERGEAGISGQWLLGDNKDWGTKAADLRQPAYQAHLLARLEVLSKAYSGFFIDTLDSYQLALSTAAWADYEEKAAAFLDAIKKKYPDKILIANRGFEIIDRTAKGTLDAVAAESLFNGLDTRTMTYKAMPEKDTAWLKAKLGQYAARGLPVIVIDYLPPAQKNFGRELAGKIRALGFIPFITDATLGQYGLSDISPVEREILFIAGENNDIFFSPLHQLAQLPVEYLGFDAKLLKESEIYALAKDYRPQGIVVWLEDSLAKEPARFRSWIKSRIKDGVKVVFINSFGFEPNPENLKELGLNVEDNLAKYGAPVTIQGKAAFADFETPAYPDYDSFLLKTEATPLVTARNARGQVFNPAALTPWGGYALYSSLARDINGETLWELNPFEFFKRTLRLPDLPAPDLTTENGRRIFFSQIDGDGFIEPCERQNKKIAAEALLEEVFSKYDLPFSASVIEGEISGHGAYPQQAARYEAAARNIFKLPNIEAASHSFSHPFYWGVKTDVSLYKDHNLPIKGYNFDPAREIYGSRDYIDTLLPAGKKVKTFFWTGNCLPDERQIALVKKAGLFNLNGGGATLTSSNPWLARVPPAFISRHAETQVYAPMQNENVYNEGWHFPFYRYIQVLETLKLTDTPRRLKPVDIYFHYFSGSKLASLNAVKRVLDAAQGMKTAQLFAGEYAARALDFKTTYLALAPDGGWLVKNNGQLRTLRAENQGGLPDLARSKGLAGFKKENGYTYLHLDGSGDYRLYFNGRGAALPYIQESSAIINKFERDRQSFTAALTARGRGEVVIGNAPGCRIKLNGALTSNPVKITRSGDYAITCECK